MRKPEIHKKVWGIEKWIANKPEYCGKILIINQGYRSSIHYHEKKDETFYLLSGTVLMEINGEERIMREDDVQEMHPGTRHRFTGLEKSVIIEFSTHHEEIDSYRDTESQKIPEEEFRQLLERLKIQT